MTPVAVGVVGAGRHAAALAEYAAPLAGASVSAVAPAPDGRDRAAAAALARRLGAAFRRTWDAMATDPALPVVLVAAEDVGRRAVETALSAGKIVVYPGAAAITRAELDRLAAAAARGGGTLLAAGELRAAQAGARAIEAATQDGLGTLHSIYAAIRLPIPDRPDRAAPILERAGWDLLDFVCAAASGPVRVSATVAGLFGGTADTAVIIARLAGDTILTAELSSCLPPSVATAPQGEVEIELIGSRDALRIEPFRAAVRFYGQRETARLPWLDEPVITMVHQAVRIATGEAARPDPFDHWRRVIAAMDAINMAAARGDTITPA